MASAHWNDLDDSSSVSGSLLSASTLSFTPGPGALAGRFLKLLGEKSLDLVVRVMIRSRLAAIERTLETSPHVFYNPTEDKEWKMTLGAYRDLRELCRESQSDYYPSSFQSTAARLVQDITNAIQSAPQDSFTKDLAGVGRWEELLAHVQNRVVVTHTVETFDFPHHGAGMSGLERPPAVKARHDSRQYSAAEREYPRPSSPLPTRKVLVLGVSAVGKSTLLEQIIETFRLLPSCRLLLPYSPLSRDEEFITSDAVMDAIRDVFKANVNPWNLAGDKRDLFNQVTDENYPHYGLERTRFSDGFRDAINILWTDPVVQKSVHKSRTSLSQSMPAHEISSLSLESTCYILDNAHRIFKADYHPTHEDRIRGKYVPTHGIWEYRCHDGSNIWEFTDIGGTRFERKKWIYTFGRSPAVLFVAALSDYNKRLPEDPEMNSLYESLVVFDSLVHSKFFEHSLIILFLNKVDLFSQALQSSPLEDHDYEKATKDHFSPWYSNQFSTCEEELEGVGSYFHYIAEKHGKEIHIVYGSAVNSHTTQESWKFMKEKIDEAHQNLEAKQLNNRPLSSAPRPLTTIEE